MEHTSDHNVDGGVKSEAVHSTQVTVVLTNNPDSILVQRINE